MRQFWVLLNFFLLGVAYSLCSVGLWGWGAHGVAAVLGDEGHSSPSTGSTAASFKHDAYGNSSAAGSMIYRGPRRTSLLGILAGVAAAAAIAAVAFLLFRCFVSLKHSVASAAGRHLAERDRSCEPDGRGKSPHNDGANPAYSGRSKGAPETANGAPAPKTGSASFKIQQSYC